jgi:hypothetical protein
MSTAEHPVSANGTTKVIGFGIAKARDRLTQETRLGVVRANCNMRPSGAQLAVDVRADIWAIGAFIAPSRESRPMMRRAR